MQLNARPFVAEDQDLYLGLSREFYQTRAVDHTVPEDYFEATFHQCVQDGPYARGYILEKDGAPVGYALLSLTWSNEAGGLTVLLEELYVCPEHQGGGIGSQFITLVEESFAGRAKRFRLEVTAANTQAIALYERLGYQSIPYIQMIKEP